MDVIEEAREQGLNFPLVIRFQDLLRHRVETINAAFNSAIQEAGYQNCYRGVFPIKVNQLREVVEEIMDAGRRSISASKREASPSSLPRWPFTRIPRAS